MKLLFLFLTLTITTTAWAQKKTVKQAAKDKSLLWEISGNGLKSSSYLFGTYHLAGKRIVDSLPIVRKSFDNCQAVVGEVIMNDSVAAKMMPAMMLPKSSLDSIFTPAEYQLIRDKFKEITGSDGLQALNKFKPAALQFFLLAYTAPKTITPENPQLDTYFQSEGTKRGEHVIGLETVEFQSDLLLNGPMENQKKHLLGFMRDVDKNKALMLRLYKSYLQQDIATLAKMMFDDENDYTQQEMDALLKNRNLNWINKLPAIMQAQPTFIAVGAGHLVGEYGLIDQLRLKGYKVTAVKM